MFQHRIQDRQQLAHARGQGNFGRLPRGAQPLVEGFEHRIMTHGDQGAHIQHAAHQGATTPHGALAPQGPAVPVEGGTPTRAASAAGSGCPAPADRPTACGRARAPPPAYFATDRRAPARAGWRAMAAADVGIEVSQPLLQPGDMGLNIGPDGPWGPC